MEENALSEHINKALEYVGENIDPEEVKYIVYHMDKYRCPARRSDTTTMKVIDLMDEYAHDNDLPEEFWDDEMDENDLMFKLYEILFK